MRLFLEIVFGGFAAFGILSAACLVLDAGMRSDYLSVAVIVPDREARQALDDLLADARRATFKNSETPLIVLFGRDAMDDDMALSREEEELLARYGAEYYRIGT